MSLLDAAHEDETVAEGEDYLPPRWLRNPHVQSALGTSPWRRRRGAAALAETGATTSAHIVDGGAGVRLQGLFSTIPGREPRGLALLLHGWEGSAESSYMRMTAARMLVLGHDVFRLNFRDHGGTHHLNEDIFHSCRIEEVVQAARDVSRRFGQDRPMTVAGYSLGGNFALRMALQAPAAGLPLARAAAVCPVLDPAHTMQWMEDGRPFYLHYFERKWRESLRRKRDLFPQATGFDDATLRLGMRELTEWLVRKHTEYGSLERYFDGYCVAGDRLASLQVPVDILMAEDDPVVPVADFRELRLPTHSHVRITRWGGHCGFLEDATLSGYAERWVAARLVAD